MNHIPATLRRMIAFTMAIVMATASCIIPAQTIPRQPTADSTHTYRNWGTPKGKDEVCNAGFVLSGNQCVALNTGSGATLLPHKMPAGSYTNSAPFPLLVTVTPPHQCYNSGIYVNGDLAAWMADACEGSRTSVTFFVPASATFSFAEGDARVTAMANGATWQQTAIDFEYVAKLLKRESASTSAVASTVCYWDILTWLVLHNIKEGSRTFTTEEGYYCTGPEG